MIPADSEDINAEYQILLSELRKFNEELMFKERILAITKADMLDDQLQQEMHDELDVDCPVMFISAVSGKGIIELKDKLWAMMQI
jgi:GTP-binding protein